MTKKKTIGENELIKRNMHKKSSNGSNIYFVMEIPIKICFMSFNFFPQKDFLPYQYSQDS